jgi:hypothetical protein
LVWILPRVERQKLLIQNPLIRIVGHLLLKVLQILLMHREEVYLEEVLLYLWHKALPLNSSGI